MKICCPLPELIGGVGSPASYYTIAAITNARAPKRVLEFGTYLGVGILTIALNTSQDATIYTIDLPDQVDSESLPTLEHSADKMHIRVLRHRVGEAFTGCEFAGKIRQIRADSLTLKLNHYVGTDAIDMVYVDGGHSFGICKRDSETALSVLSPHGVILWDDYWWFYPDVVRYLDSLSELFLTLTPHQLGKIGQISVEFHDFLFPEMHQQVELIKQKITASGFYRICFSHDNTDVLFINKRKITMFDYLYLSIWRRNYLGLQRVVEHHRGPLR